MKSARRDKKARSLERERERERESLGGGIVLVWIMSNK
jgi:hypothetical protein